MTSVSNTKLDPIKRFSSLIIDGEEYKLVFNFNVIAESEKDTNCNLLRGLLDLDNLSATQLRGLLFAALKVGQPEIVVKEQAGALIRIDTIPAIYNALAEAYMLAMPDKKEGDEEKKTPDN